MAVYTKKKLEFIVNDIGPKLLPLFPKEELLKQLTLEDRLQGLTAEVLRKRLKELEEHEEN